jgi:UDP-2,4-diacetamido-2,4,6-trideoxy-beta-L-altropyranose hydrolase
MRVAFRVDASLKIGSGHVIRCLTLATALREKGADCEFISREHQGNLIDLVRQRRFRVNVLPPESKPSIARQGAAYDFDWTPYESWLGAHWQTDAEQTGDIVANRYPDWLITDHYALDHRWEAKVRPHASKLMVIDDLADRKHDCDLLLDQNLGHQPRDYTTWVSCHCKVLAGPGYALLRPEFARLRAYSLQRRQQPTLKRLLITMGGVDEPNATGQVLQALQHCELPTDCKIVAVMGPKSPWRDQVRLLAKEMVWSTEVLVDIGDMAECMADSDLAIGAAGSTSWERCCLGLPTLIIATAENQRDAAQQLASIGAAHLLLIEDQLTEQMKEIFKQLKSGYELLDHMSNQASRIVDGLGSDRVISALQLLQNDVR